MYSTRLIEENLYIDASVNAIDIQLSSRTYCKTHVYTYIFPSTAYLNAFDAVFHLDYIVVDRNLERKGKGTQMIQALVDFITTIAQSTGEQYALFIEPDYGTFNFYDTFCSRSELEYTLIDSPFNSGCSGLLIEIPQRFDCDKKSPTDEF